MSANLKSKVKSMLEMLDACLHQNVQNTECSDQYYHLQYVNRYTCLF